MPYSDLPIDELRTYRPNLAVPADLDAFWEETLRETRSHATPATFTPVDSGLTVIRSFDVTFPGFGGSPVRGWLHLPAATMDPLPGVVEYIGYGGGRGLAHQRVRWAAAGFAHLVMDTRGQGSTWSVGHTPDPDGSGAPAHPGFMTRGILDPRTYYYRRVISDAVRAVEAVREHPAVDASRIAVTGGSQGGGLSIAVAGLVDDLAAVMPDVPFLCDLPRALGLADTDPYAEIARYLRVHRDGVETALRDAGLLRWRDPRPARDGACALLGRAHGYRLPALHRVRRVQLVWGSQGDPRVRLQ